MSAVDVIVVPWDSGRHEWRMGRGPRVLEGTVFDVLASSGCSGTSTSGFLDGMALATALGAVVARLASAITAVDG